MVAHKDPISGEIEISGGIEKGIWVWCKFKRQLSRLRMRNNSETPSTAIAVRQNEIEPHTDCR